MRISKKLLIFSLALSAILSSVSLFNAVAQTVPMTDQQLELIRANCTSVKTTLNQLHSSDALLRVNVGQVYESMSTKLMENFNIRATNNNMNSAGLITATTNYGLLLDTFRADYITYEKQLSSTMSIDCNAQPTAFYDAVALARTKREQIHTDVVNLNLSLDQYNLALDQFKVDNQIEK